MVAAPTAASSLSQAAPGGAGPGVTRRDSYYPPAIIINLNPPAPGAGPSPGPPIPSRRSAGRHRRGPLGRAGRRGRRLPVGPQAGLSRDSDS